MSLESEIKSIHEKLQAQAKAFDSVSKALDSIDIARTIKLDHFEALLKSLTDDFKGFVREMRESPQGVIPRLRESERDILDQRKRIDKLELTMEGMLSGDHEIRKEKVKGFWLILTAAIAALGTAIAALLKG